MRIIAGQARGRTLQAPPEGTRPMTSRAKESLFSIIQSRIPGARVLDLYAGSGSLGLEALSRGAVEAVFVERARRAQLVIRKNIDAVGLGGDLRPGKVETVVPELSGTFDIVFVDPPYADGDRQVAAVLASLEDAVSEGGLVVLHRQGRNAVALPDFLTSSDERRYGDAVVTLMERVT